MAHINGRPEIPAGYFHERGDTEKTGTARRSTYKPSLSDRITNRFARNERPALAKFVNGVRNLDLSLRQSVNQRRLNSARDRFQAVDSREDASTEELQVAGAPARRFEHIARRLETKKMLGQTALAGELKEGLEQATEGLQDDLRQDGYVPLTGLRATSQESLPSRYLVSPDDGHRIKVNSERPPLLARMIANSVSAGYDRGSSGASRSIRSTLQHALVGVYSAEQSIKGMAARSLSGSSRLDDGARARMDVRAARTGQKRTMLQASLQGNEALNNAYRSVVNEQIAAADTRLDDPNGPRYEVRPGVGAIKPPQTHFWERRVNAYYRSREEEATPMQSPSRSSSPAPSVLESGSESSQDTSPTSRSRSSGAIARFAIGVSNLRGKAAHSVHKAIVRDADAKMQRSEDPAERARYAERGARHQAGADKWEHTVTVRRSTLQGKLIDTLKDDKARELMDNSFPQSRDGRVHNPKPWEVAEDDDDLYN